MPQPSSAARRRQLRPTASGQRPFQLDRGDAGVKERWFVLLFEQPTRPPGALQNQGFAGTDITVDTKWTGEVGLDAWL